MPRRSDCGKRVCPPVPTFGRKTVEVAVYVPSTRNGQPVTPTAFNRRVDTTREFMSKLYGGDTTVQGQGGYYDYDEGVYIDEEVAVVVSWTSVHEYNESKHELGEFIVSKRNGWKQDTLGFEVDGEFFMYPEKDWMKSDPYR